MAIFRSKIFYACCVLVVGVIILSVVLFFTNEGVATEFRQVRQSKPNLFFVGIDVSATIDKDTLEDFKNNVVSRLKHFIGEQSVSYAISSFGSPGCAKKSVKNIVSTKSPEDESSFTWKVKKKIRNISVSKLPPATSRIRLTTPLNYLLQSVLPKRTGGRVIIFSDLLNDDSDCPRQYPFPKKAITEFGKNKQGQIIFIYPTPRLTKTPKYNERTIKSQLDFIEKMRKLSNEGKVRTFFYHIPDDPAKRSRFMKSQLQNAIPVTQFEIIMERVSRVIDTMVSAVRG
ncbi:MAG: hypothetical protein GY795_06100 [Desulfobacterales bacterium]|nr:hypothetical protein [Desulfobacterales bacterium]